LTGFCHSPYFPYRPEVISYSIVSAGRLPKKSAQPRSLAMGGNPPVLKHFVIRPKQAKLHRWIELQ
jgi:hypothetical protein